MNFKKIHLRKYSKRKRNTYGTGSESAEERAFKSWCDLANVLKVKIANEGRRGDVEKCQLGLMGARSGFPDCFVLLPNKKILFVEMKQNRNYTASEKKTKHWQQQERWIEYLNKRGWPAKMCFGWEQAMYFVKEYL